MQEINNFTPVLIPTLNRFEHFKRCVESLSKCTYADKTDLYIALDYPLKETHWEGYNQIKEYIENLNGFNNVFIIKREKNYGATGNLFDAQKTIFEKYDRMILSEDDNEFSPNFLAFVNWGLEKYKDDDRIFAICAYNYPIDMSGYDKDYYFNNVFSAWGCGIWKDKWEYVQNNVFTNDYLKGIFKSRLKLLKLIRDRIRIVPALIKCKNNNEILGDMIISSYLCLYDKFCVFPRKTKVRNWGHDGSGINCGYIKGEDIFLLQELDTDNYYLFSNNIVLHQDKYIKREMNKYLKISFKSKIRIILSIIKAYK